MNLAIIGSGGREHAICYKLKQSPKIKKFQTTRDEALIILNKIKWKDGLFRKDIAWRVIKTKKI